MPACATCGSEALAAAKFCSQCGARLNDQASAIEPDLRERVMKYAWLDHAPIPWQLKTIWAHHRYVLGRVG